MRAKSKKTSKLTPLQELIDSLRRPPEEIFNPEQAAKFLGLSTRTLYKLIHTGQIPAKRIGNQWRLARSILEKFIREGKDK